MRLEVAFAGAVNRLWTDRDDADETKHVPFGIKWLHREFAHGAEYQECIFDEEIFHRQRPVNVSAIYVQFLLVRVVPIIKFTRGARKLDALLTSAKGMVPRRQLLR